MRRQAFVVGLMVILSGCGNDNPSCGAGNVTDTVINLARKKLTQEGQNTLDPNVQQLAAGTFSVEAIRTQTSSDTKVSCSAELHATLKGTQLRPLDKLKENGINTEPVFPITYEAQRTDDGKSTYVTLHGVD